MRILDFEEVSEERVCRRGVSLVCFSPILQRNCFALAFIVHGSAVSWLSFVECERVCVLLRCCAVGRGMPPCSRGIVEILQEIH
jgi:hypothetical protein